MLFAIWCEISFQFLLPRLSVESEIVASCMRILGIEIKISQLTRYFRDTDRYEHPSNGFTNSIQLMKKRLVETQRQQHNSRQNCWL